MSNLTSKFVRWSGVVLFLLLISACTSGTTPEPTVTPLGRTLNPEMFAPESASTGTAPNVNVDATAVIPVTSVAVNPPSAAFLPTMTVQSLPVLGGNTTTDTTTANTGAVTNTTCAAPAGWVAYTVQTGDTLGALAENTGLTQAALVAANCLTDAYTILVGQVLYVPQTVNNTNAVASVPTLANAANNTTVNATAVPNPNITTNANLPLPTVNLVGVVIAGPAIVQPNGEFQLTSGTTVTLRALGIGNTATQFTFYLLPVDAPAGTQATIIGTDTNIADGITILWPVLTPNLHANIWAIANTGAATQPIPILTK